MSAAYDLATYIANTLSKGILGTNVFCNYMPDSPSTCITVYQYGGSESDMGMGKPDANPLENVSLQINSRHADQETAESTIYDIYKSLDGLGDVTINSVAYIWLKAMQPPFLLLRQENGNYIFAFNMSIQKRRS